MQNLKNTQRIFDTKPLPSDKVRKSPWPTHGGHYGSANLDRLVISTNRQTKFPQYWSSCLRVCDLLLPGCDSDTTEEICECIENDSRGLRN